MPIFVAEFAQQLAQFIEEDIPNEFIRRQIDTAMFMYNRFRYYTPKPGMTPEAPYSSGHAVLNWMVSIDYMTNDENGVRTRGGRGGTTAKNFTETYYRTLFGTRTTSGNMRYKLGTRSVQKKGSTIHVYNNVKYMQFLIDGNSKAAPQGWFDLVLEETKDFMDRKGITK